MAEYSIIRLKLCVDSNTHSLAPVGCLEAPPVTKAGFTEAPFRFSQSFEWVIVGRSTVGVVDSSESTGGPASCYTLNVHN
jgi:hypothetical protein